MKESTTNHNGIVQYNSKLHFNEQEIKDRVRLYFEKAPDKLYKSDIVVNDKKTTTRSNGYLTADGKSFCEIIAKEVVRNKNEWKVQKDENCTYNDGKRTQMLERLRTTECADVYKSLEYCLSKNSNSYSETRLMHCLCAQVDLGEFKAVDFQVTTTNSKKDNVDIILEDDACVYMVEAKTFGSNESLLRCVLEIETYFRKLNQRFFEKYCKGKELKKAVLFDKESWAYKQKDEWWAKELLKAFDVTVLELSSITKTKQNGKFIVKKV